MAKARGRAKRKRRGRGDSRAGAVTQRQCTPSSAREEMQIKLKRDCREPLWSHSCGFATDTDNSCNNKKEEKKGGSMIED